MTVLLYVEIVFTDKYILSYRDAALENVVRRHLTMKRALEDPMNQVPFRVAQRNYITAHPTLETHNCSNR